jgi:hypothetical protein
VTKRRARVTQLKIRAIPLERMPKSRFFHLIREACRTGIVPAGIRLTTLNWDHGVGRSFQAGDVLSANDAQELRNCGDFMFGPDDKHDVRVERPE